jgi:hypothetical protein
VRSARHRETRVSQNPSRNRAETNATAEHLSAGITIDVDHRERLVVQASQKQAVRVTALPRTHSGPLMTIAWSKSTQTHGAWLEMPECTERGITARQLHRSFLLIKDLDLH